MPSEALFTEWGEGWTAPDAQSAEDQWRTFVGAWVQLQRPALVIETGAGSGTITREIAENLPDGSALLAFEGEPYWRAQATKNLRRLSAVHVPEVETPAPTDFAAADLAILDCDPELRKREIAVWGEHARPGTYCLIHDCTTRYQELDVPRPSCHGEIAAAVDLLGIPWLQTPNPRGGALLRHP